MTKITKFEKKANFNEMLIKLSFSSSVPFHCLKELSVNSMSSLKKMQWLIKIDKRGTGQEISEILKKSIFF